ncbi:hypothetical protein [Blastopirellula marina]|uniref:Uncharacterized protein n=1 Tax=Blastopirellula marina TaxID=124 RepID=A0A2S8GGK3_9BACT|nr:hypothetical protein [Blastopirellula marina]PQO43553.1 hypothetical protein C5Y93_23170 [Blastopirellula marina]
MPATSSVDPLHPWRSDPIIRRVAVNYPLDQIEMLLHDGGLPLSQNKPEVCLVEIEAMPSPGLFQGKVRGTVEHLPNVQTGDNVQFVLSDAMECGVLVTKTMLNERSNWSVFPCKQCGFDELLAPPSKLIPALYPDLPAEPQTFTSVCGLCGGEQFVTHGSLNIQPKRKPVRRDWSITALVAFCVGCAALGALPGLLMFFTVWPAPAPLVIALFGAIIGGGLSIPGVSSERVGAGVTGLMIAKNVPGGKQVADKMIQPPTERDIDPVSKWLTRKLIQFLTPHCPKPRSWVVFFGVGCGLILGLSTISHDQAAMAAQRETYLLPIPGSKDPPTTQALMVAIMFAVWGGSIGGLLASKTYRRFVLLGALISAVGGLFLWLLMLAGNGNPSYLMAFGFISVLVLSAMLISAFFSANVDWRGEEELELPLDD